MVSTLGLYLNSDADNMDWEKVYLTEPLSSTVNDTAPHGRGWFNITDPAQIARVLGGEACLWGEHADPSNLLVRLFPRAAALGERLTAPRSLRNTTEALPRLLRHRCRLIQRGISAPPLQPGYC